METYRIVVTTDPYNAQRHVGFDRFTHRKVIKTGLSLKEAHGILLDIFNGIAENEGKYFPNWGLAVAWRGCTTFYARLTRKDGTRGFRYDVFNYEIESESENGFI